MNAFLKAQFPFVTDDQLTKIDAFYPRIPGDYPNTGPFFLTLAQAYGEMRYICPGIYISSAFANLSEYPSWNYRYDVHDPGMDADGSGVTHTIEVSAIWGPNNTNGNAPQSYYEGGINADAVRVTQGYWTSFIRSYDPNKYRAEGAPVWEAFGQDQARRIVIRTNDTAMEDVPEEQRERCAYLNEIGPELQQFFSTEIPPPSFHAS